MRNIIFIIVVLLALLGCESRSQKTDVGFVGTLTGRYSDLGQSILHGALLAIENSEHASEINLVVKDDYGNPTEGTAILAEFAKKNIRYIIGPNLSSVATAMVPHLAASGQYMLSPSTSTSDLAGKEDNFVRTMPHNNFKQAEIISRYLINKLGVKDIVILYDSRNASYSNDIVMKFTEAFMLGGGDVADVRPFNPDKGDSFADMLAKDAAAPPAMYYIIGSAMDTSLLIWQIRKLGFKSEILIRKWAASNDFFRLGGEAIEGVKLFDFYIDDTSEAYKTFKKNYIERFKKEPGWMGVFGYEAASIMADALPDLKNGADFLAALQKRVKDSKLLLGLSFDEFGDAHLPLHYFEIVNGETVYKGKAE